jgi:hypothetical protein
MNDTNWLQANRRVLFAEFARIRTLISGADGNTAGRELSEARAALPSASAIDLLAQAFGLTSFERDVLLLCASAEMEVATFESCAQVNLQPHSMPTFGMALAQLPEAHWSALTPVRPLRRWNLVHVGGGSLTTAPLSIEERALHFLAGANYLDPKLAANFRPVDGGIALAPSHSGTADTVIAAVAATTSDTVLIQLVGDDPAAHLGIAHKVSSMLDLRLHVVSAAELVAHAREMEDLAIRWYRESLLLASALLVETTEQHSEVAMRFAERVKGLIFVASARHVPARIPCLLFPADRPIAREQKELWCQALGARSRALNGALDALAANFRLDTDGITQAAESLACERLEPSLLGKALWSACRRAAHRRLDGLAQRVESRADWDGLVLPSPQIAALRQIAAHVRSRTEVYEKWGFASKGNRGLGISVLFAGESGTGKTMAAEVLANDLELDLYRIDLASMVSKYIGETEKNLRQVFDAAEDTGAILLFDEADALFGSRSEVKDSHDRYANIEVSYLLQRMEAYRGLAILTTNLKNAIDPAFQRRLRFIIQFQFPDDAHREQIWRGIFPEQTPLADVDYRRLAQLNVAGGHIRNIALGAAFLAADSGTAIGMSHLLQAARTESGKRDRPFSDAELRGWQ